MSPAPFPVVLTRPAGRNEALAHALRAQGCEPLELPALAIRGLSCSLSELPLPGDHDLVVFVSGTAVRAYASQLQDVAGMQHWPAHVPAACVGPATAAAMRGGFWPEALRILHPAADAPAHDSEALWQVPQESGLAPRRVLIVRGTAGREWLARRLEQAGATVARHAVYERLPAAWPEGALQILRAWRGAGRDPAWLLTSGEGLDAVHARIRDAGLEPWWLGHRFVVTHPRLAARLHELARRQDKDAAAMVKICLPRDGAIVRAFLSMRAASP